jgi:hypothetical protein
MLHDSDPAAPAAQGVNMFTLVHTLLPKIRVPNSFVMLDACHAGLAAGVKDLAFRPAAHFANLTAQ